MIDIISGQVNSALLEGMRRQYQDKLEKSLARWRYWLPRIEHATEADIAAMKSLYRQEIVAPERLLKLKSSEHRGSAYLDISEGAGILHDDESSDANVERYLPPHGFTNMIKNPDGEMLGIYSMRTGEAARATLTEEFGWEPGKRYQTAADLPARCGMSEMTWTAQADRAIKVFNAANNYGNSVAVPGVLLVRKTDSHSILQRDTGKALGLKVSGYGQLQGAHTQYTVTTIFEIVEVDGYRLPESVPNKFSRRLNPEMGGSLVGQKRERFVRRDGIELLVDWGIYVSEVQGFLDIANAK